LKEERIVYVSGYDRHLAFVDLENYLRKYGEIVHVESKIDNVRNHDPFGFRKEGIRALSSLSTKTQRVLSEPLRTAAEPTSSATDSRSTTR
jgi:hypothetical protein